MVIAELVNGVLRSRYVPGPNIDEYVVWYQNIDTSTDKRAWYLTDQLGSTIAFSGNTGTGTARLRYDAYGQPQSTNVGRIQYTGQIWLPEAGLYYYRARFYNPRIGRFMQTDPIMYAGGANFYAYVGNDPVNATDPMGLCGGDPRHPTTHCQRINSSSAGNGGPNLGGLTAEGRSYTDSVGSAFGDVAGRPGDFEVVGVFTGGSHYGYGGFTSGLIGGGGMNRESGGGGSGASVSATREVAPSGSSYQCPEGDDLILAYRIQEVSGELAQIGVAIAAVGGGLTLFGQPELGGPVALGGGLYANAAGAQGTASTIYLAARGDRRSLFALSFGAPLALLGPAGALPAEAILAGQLHGGITDAAATALGIPDCTP